MDNGQHKYQVYYTLDNCLTSKQYKLTYEAERVDSITNLLHEVNNFE